MSILPYCIVDEFAEIHPPAFGVREATIHDLSAAGLRCFYSEMDGMPTAETVREDALQFHEFVHAAFAQGTVIPFRFVTLLESEDELEAFLRRKAEAYVPALERLEGTVQFEMRISNKSPEQVEETATEDSRERQAALHDAAAALQQAAGDLALGWHTRNDEEHARCYGLVRRDSAQALREKLSKVALPPEIRVVMSGPWPPSEFVDVQAQQA
ncbi:MAG TPA: GvpL/GvpF family gas vesicle protein [Clostridia bacterium]|nr:GvpL/GvpF family gas vesicle protein [Clostridia bacterium]